MTRYARANNAHKQQPHASTSWKELKGEKRPVSNDADSAISGNESSRHGQFKRKQFSKFNKTKNQGQTRFPAKRKHDMEPDVEEASDLLVQPTTNKKVCFKCRKPGHVLMNCPMADKTDRSTLCYKCGSTEHISKHCKKKSSSEAGYPYAVCFLCGKQGHISSACPESSKGIYPNGGACHHCDSVDHMKMNCPQLKRTESSEQPTVCFRQTNDVSCDADITTENITVKNAAKKLKVINFK